MAAREEYQKIFISHLEEALKKARDRQGYVDKVAEGVGAAAKQIPGVMRETTHKVLNYVPAAVTSFVALSVGLVTTAVVTAAGIYLSTEVDKIKNLDSWIKTQNDIGTLAGELEDYLSKNRGDALGINQEKDNTFLKSFSRGIEQIKRLQNFSIAEEQAHVDVQIAIDLMECNPKPATQDNSENPSIKYFVELFEKRQKEEAEAEQRKAEEEQKKAEAKKMADDEKQKAEETKKQAELEQKKAEEEKKRAEAELKQAEEERKRTEAEQQRAEAASQTARTATAPSRASSQSTSSMFSISGILKYLAPDKQVDTNLGLDTDDQVNPTEPAKKAGLTGT